MKQPFQKRRAVGEVELHRVLRVTGNLAFLPLAAAFAGSTALTSSTRTRLWRAFVLIHLVHGGALVALRRRHHRSGNEFSLVSRLVGPVGYASLAALTIAELPPGPPPESGWRRTAQRAGQNVLLAIYAFTIGHGYLAKGRRAGIYGPLAALWIAAAVGMDRSWRMRPPTVAMGGAVCFPTCIGGRPGALRCCTRSGR